MTVLAAAAAVSNLLVAIAPSFRRAAGRPAPAGCGDRRFWAMSLAVASRLSTPGRLGRSMMLVNTGTTLATVAGVPVAVYLGALAGWQAVFVGVAVLSALTALTIRTVLPRVAPDAADGLRPLVDTLRAPGMPRGLAGHVLTVLGLRRVHLRPARARDRPRARRRRGGRAARGVRRRWGGGQPRRRDAGGPVPAAGAVRRPAGAGRRGPRRWRRSPRLRRSSSRVSRCGGCRSVPG
ncbi:MFS transporter [Pseudonocardia sp. ICBG601]|uniref:MFS transporter n=1 Tax=Pseudonocardia sp. ICBG601 TaxID=2846759 RepID=UPI0021F5FED6|nr:MFS transporter [Pseudonocardia sp. ICBG601]